MAPRLPRFNPTQAAADARKLERIIGDVEEAELATATAGGDRRALRGIPCVGHGLGSTAPGTDPLRALIAKQRD